MMETVKLIVGLAGILLTVRFGVRIILRTAYKLDQGVVPSWLVALGVVAMMWGFFL